MENEIAVKNNDLDVVKSEINGSLILDAKKMDSMYRLAEIMSKGRSTIPAHLAGNVGDCMAIVMQSIQWNMNPFSVAQKTHLVNGALGYEAQLVNAVVLSSNVVEGRFVYEWFGDWSKVIGKSKVVDVPARGKFGEKDYKKNQQYRVHDHDMHDEDGLGVRVSAKIRGETEPRVLDLLLSQASVRNSPLWATDPKQQLAYLAVKKWARLYSPDVILGVYSTDEFEQVNNQNIDPINMGAADVITHKIPKELIDEASAAAIDSVDAYQKFWASTGKENRKLLENFHDEFKQAAVKADQDKTIAASDKFSDSDYVPE